MRRKFNYTKRQKIYYESVSIRLVKMGDKTSFNAQLLKDDLSFPDESHVYVEAYYGGKYLRFDFGQFRNIVQPDDTDITELQKLSDKVYFRIKVVDESSTNGLILGLADKVPLVDSGEPEGKTAILPVNPILMDTHEMWRVNFDADPEGIPILEVNRNIDGIKDIARGDVQFIALVYPAAIRQILQRIAYDEQFEVEDKLWGSQWVGFCENTLGVSGTPQNSNDKPAVELWIDDVVRAFCVKFKTLDKYINHLV